MRLKIDTDSKVIQVEQQCKLVELFDFVKKIFPDNKWKEYSIEAVVHIYDWNRPIYVPAPFTYTDINPFTITSTTDTATYCIQTN